jgi:hypothetical protein
MSENEYEIAIYDVISFIICSIESENTIFTVSDTVLIPGEFGEEFEMYEITFPEN